MRLHADVLRETSSMGEVAAPNPLPARETQIHFAAACCNDRN